MNATNRILNRGVLLIVGLVLAAGGALAVVAGVRPGWAAPLLDDAASAAGGLLGRLGDWRVGVEGGASAPGALIVLLGAGLLCGILALVFLCTRGGGRTAEVLRAESGRGTTAVDRNVADAVLTGVVDERRDVLAVRSAAYRVGGSPALALTVSTRRGAALDAVIAAAETAVQDWDALSGWRSPVLVHLADPRWRDAWRSRARVQ